MGYGAVQIRKSPFPSAPPGAHNFGALMRSNPNTIAEIPVLEKQRFKNLQATLTGSPATATWAAVRPFIQDCFPRLSRHAMTTMARPIAARSKVKTRSLFRQRPSRADCCRAAAAQWATAVRKKQPFFPN